MLTIQNISEFLDDQTFQPEGQKNTHTTSKDDLRVIKLIIDYLQIHVHHSECLIENVRFVVSMVTYVIS